MFLAFMVRRLLMAHMDEEKNMDNRDFFGNKRLELAGTLISYVFEDAFKRYNSMLMATANKSIPKVKVCQFDVTKHMTSNLITHALNNAISTGNWNIRRFRISRVGVSQVLSYRWHKRDRKIQQQLANRQQLAGGFDGPILSGKIAPSITLMHILYSGVLWRYFKLFTPVDLSSIKREVRDLCVLRMVHAFCQAAPMLLLQVINQPFHLSRDLIRS